MIRLALLRHGHTAWNRAGQIQGRTDIPLDAEARDHLATLRLPAPWEDADISASPLVRAVETAQLVSGRMPRQHSALTEMNWGAWEGKRGADLLAQEGSGYRHVEHWGWAYRPPLGESPSDVRGRVLPWVASLTNDTVAVCHIGIMRVLMAQATGWAFNGPAPFRIKRDRLYVIDIGQSWHLHPDPVRLERRAP